MVGAFPDGNSVLMLVAARLRHVAGTKGGTRCYLDSERDQGSEGSQRGRMTATLETMDLIRPFLKSIFAKSDFSTCTVFSVA